ncbi:MAG: hypothetical protein AB1798_19130, partial [Spirochaetota bacterium]
MAENTKTRVPINCVNRYGVDKILLITLLFLGSTVTVIFADYPEIKTLNNSDILFKQLQENISLYYQNRANNKEIPALAIFKYRPSQKDTLYTAAARLNLPFDALATLNRISNPGRLPAARDLY